MKLAFRNTFAPPLAAIAFIIALLLAKWAGAAELQTESVTVCTRRPMHQGKVNETVLVCETVRVRNTKGAK